MPCLLVVPGLRHRGVRLVRARRRDAFVLEIDLRRRAERLLETARADERRRPPHAVDVADRLGDLDRALGRYLLEDQGHREQRLEIGGADRLLRARMQHRRQRLRQIGREVVPGFRDLRFVENVFELITHATLHAESQLLPHASYPGSGGGKIRYRDHPDRGRSRPSHRRGPAARLSAGSRSPAARRAPPARREGRRGRRCPRGTGRRRRPWPSR